MKKNIGKYIMYGGITIAVIGILLFLSTKSASASTAEVPKTGGDSLDAKIITNFDSVWDYKLENGIWYTKKKAETAWSEMKKVASNYDLAVKKLNDYLNKNK